MFHPATLLLAWAGCALILPLLPLGVLALMLVPALLSALLVARRRTVALLRRARWLLLSIALLFAFSTPGLAVPGPLGGLGLTQDGLALAAEQLSRLLLLLVTLAVLHEHLGTAGFVSGLYWLLGPLHGRRGLRERIVVRLMLVVEFVESGSGAGWRHWLSEDGDSGPQSLSLAIRRPRWRDRLALLAVACAVVALAW
ncbi:MAG: CbiQ family ECF transporter T component [Rhodocyclaceae bacterium]|nr:CbiQ family ECF transporter T component [Rhodocyclaceae bacterium]